MNRKQINRLLKRLAFNEKVIKGELIETHISWILLGKQYVFKIKKPIQYSFLDFSTLQKRKYYCEREVSLNRRLTGIYLDVIPIKESPKGYVLGEGKGDVIDYAVRMKRLQEGKRMDRMLQKNAVGSEPIKSLAEKIAHFHQKAIIVSTPFKKQKAQDDFNDILVYSDWIKDHLGVNYAAILQKTVQHSDTYLDQKSRLIADRVNQGFQRDVHGDLHSRNIFLYKDPIIFDCIEFNDSFRQIDLLNELAFFCMDLEAFDQPNLSRQFIRHYSETFPCIRKLEEKQLFVYYKAYRANVRAKVNVLRAKQAMDDAQLEKYIEEVKKYLQLMDSYLFYSKVK